MGISEGHERARLVGRDEERQALRSVVDRARSGSGGIALVSGEAGVGKTALVRHVVRELGIPSVWVYASDPVTPPYAPIRSLLRSLMEMAPAAIRACEDRRKALASILPEFTSTDEDPGPGAIEDAVACILRGASRDTPLTLVLEDLQWADSATLELIPGIDEAIRGLPVAVFGTYRRDEVPRGHPLRRVHNALQRKERLYEIELGPLAEPDVKAMLHHLLGAKPTDDLVRMLQERTDGLPFFVEELAHMLLEEDRLGGRHDGLDWEPSRALPLPATLRDAVLFRLDRLSAEARPLLEVCAVLGVSFDWDTVLALAGRDDGLEELLASGVVVARDERAGAFRHALVQEVVHRETLWTTRRRLHLQAAAHLDAAGAEKSLVAWHWLKGRDLQRARRAYTASAMNSCAIHAHRDAYDAGKLALELWPEGVDGAERLELLDRLGECAQVSGLLPEAARAWKEAASQRRSAGDEAGYARTLSRLATSYGLQGTWSQAMEAREQAATAFTAAGLHAESAEERLVLASHIHSAASFSAAIGVLDGAEKEASLAGRSDLTARILGLKGVCLSKLGRASEGRELAHRGLELALREKHSAAAVEAYQRLASAVENTSDYGAAEEAYSAARMFCEGQGAVGAAQYCNACVSGVLWHRGEWNRAVAVCEEVMASPGAGATIHAVASGYLGLVLACRGETGKARPLLLEALTMARSQEILALEFVGLWGLSLVESQEDPAAALALGSSLRERWEASEERHYVIPAFRWFTTFYGTYDRSEDVRACAEALSRIAATTKSAEALASLAHASGEAALVGDDAAQAVQHFERALTLLEGATLPFQRAHTLTRAAAALMVLGRDEEARRLLILAQRIARELGARPLAASCAERLSVLAAPAPDESSRLSDLLTVRQIEVARLLVRGLSNKAMAKELGLSPRTVEMHVGNILAALGCRSRTEAAGRTAELGLFEPQSGLRA